MQENKEDLFWTDVSNILEEIENTDFNKSTPPSKRSKQSNSSIISSSNLYSSSISTDNSSPLHSPFITSKQSHSPLNKNLSQNTNVPLCSGHNIPSILYKVKKENHNFGREFYSCSLDRSHRCKFFLWKSDINKADTKIQMSNCSNFKNLILFFQMIKPDTIQLDISPFILDISKYIQNLPGCIIVSYSSYLLPLKYQEHIVTYLSSLFYNLTSSLVPLNVIQHFNQPISLHTFDSTKIPTSIWNKLFPFQQEAVRYAIERHGNVLIGDDMGLGKTITAIAISCYYQSEWPLLIICPSSLRLNWANEFRDWLSISSHVISNTKDDLSGLIVILSFDLSVKYSKKIREKSFQIIIIDESHYLKNDQSKRTRAVLPILRQSRHRILLSGTPALNKPFELYTQIHVLNPQLFPSKVQYGLRYCNGIQNQYGWDFNGSSNSLELNALLSKYVMIRRTKKEIQHQLPSKRRQIIRLEVDNFNDNEEWDYFQQEFKENSNLSFNDPFIRQQLSKQYQLCGMKKVPSIIQYLTDIVRFTNKILIYAHHQNVLEKLKDFFENQQISYIFIDGSTPMNARSDMVDQYQNQDDIKVALFSITAAGLGLNLTVCSLVVFAELHWTPSVLLQAEDRVHRIGQKNSVLIQYLVGVNTIDEYIWKKLSQKIEHITISLDGTYHNSLESQTLFFDI